MSERSAIIGDKQKCGGMSQTLIEKLTPEQEALIPVYRDKWRKIALSTEPTDHQKAIEVVKEAYAVFGEQKPDIFVFDSPIAAFNTPILKGQYKLISIIHPLKCSLENQLSSPVRSLLYRQLIAPLRRQLRSQMYRQMVDQLSEPPETKQEIKQRVLLLMSFSLLMRPEEWTSFGSLFDFCISVLNCAHEDKIWQAFENLIKSCNRIFPLEKTCILCENPTSLSFDNEQRLHAEGKPAIQFADKFSMYAYHGVGLPEEYGQLHPTQWHSQWILKEKNAELRRVLIQGIGYARIARELQAIELDSWQEYTLLKIEADVYDDPIYLLKMICPSTGFMVVLQKVAVDWENSICTYCPQSPTPDL